MTSKAARLLHVPSLLLAAGLQVMPLVRAALPVAETTANILAIVFRWAAGAAAALGGVQAVSGASTVITNPLSTNIVQGQSFTLRLTTAPEQAHYWTATGLPAGLSLSGTSGQTLWQITGSPTVTGSFSVGLTAKDQATSGSSRTVTATLVINISAGSSRPTITTPPVSQSVVQGQSASFSVTASGTAPLTYQWRFQSSALSAQTASTLVINPATTNSAGNYDVIVGDSSGSVTSAVATLTVIVPPTITTPPSSQTVTQGLSASFTVRAAGTSPLTYQWRFKGAALSGQTGSTLGVNPVTTNSAGNYDVIVANAGGSVTSAVATLTVIVPPQPPSITAQPSSLTVTQGQAASFSVSATGATPLSYQWRFKGSALSGQTASTLGINPATTNNAGAFDVIVANNVGSVTSLVANLTVIVPGSALQISSQPVSLTVTQGQSASFSVTAVGTAPLSYQWRFKGAGLSGQTSPTMLINPVTTNSAGNYDAIVSNNSGSVTSAVATLTVLLPPTIVTPPADQTVIEGSNVLFTVQAAGTAPLSFYWRKGGSVVAGPTGPSFSIVAAQSADSGVYSVIASNAAGTTLSASATLTVEAAPQAPTITAEPADQNVLPGSPAMFSVTAEGTGPLFYQWYFAGSPQPDGVGATLSLAGAQTTNVGSYYVVVRNTAGSVTSHVAMLTLATLQGSYNGLYFDPAALSVYNSGSFTATVTEHGKYTGSLMLLGNRYAFSGQFDASGRATNSVGRGKLKRWNMELELDLSAGDRLIGSITDGSWSAQVQAERSVWDARTNPAPQAGTYTLAIPGVPGGGRQSPEGAGFGLIKVTTSGRVRFQGNLADGKRVLRSGRISGSGALPFYSPLYSGEGSILGWLMFTNRTSDDVNGLLAWTKLQQPLDAYFPSGFSFQSDAAGSRYAPPAPGTRVLDFTAGQIQLAAGNLPEGLTNDVTLDTANRVVSSNDARLRLSLRLSSGWFRGTVANPANGKLIPFNGALLQKQNMGCGFFLGPNQSGSVYFGP